MGLSPPLVPYRDAGYGPATYHISILDCLKGLYKAMTVGLLDVDAFDVYEYEFYERVENGDLNWISNKFVALANPKEEMPPNLRAAAMMMYRSGHPGVTNKKGEKLFSLYRIEELVKWFQQNKVSTIVRLNNKIYDRTKFLAAGVDHVEMYFPDGTTPPESILLKFLELCETTAGKDLVFLVSEVRTQSQFK